MSERTKSAIRAIAQGAPYLGEHSNGAVRRAQRDYTPRLLVVDNDQDVRKSVAHVLTENNCTVETATSAPEAMETLGAGDYDLVIMSLVLPGADGFEALEQIKSTWPDVDVIMMTGYASIDAAVELMKAGASEMIIKPIKPEHVHLIVEKTLYRRELEQSARERDHFEQLAQVDGLTGAYNHRYFHQILDAEVRHAGRPLSLLMIDVDDFKFYNDCNGHPAGDKALRQLADFFKLKSRGTDFVARYGGEEFAIVLTDTPKAGAEIFAGRLVKAVAEHTFEHGDAQPLGALTVSMGLANYPDDARTKVDLIEKADQALYQAKSEGKNRLCVYTKGMAARPQERGH